MDIYTGKSIFQKVAVGKVLYYEKNENQVKRSHAADGRKRADISGR